MTPAAQFPGYKLAKGWESGKSPLTEAKGQWLRKKVGGTGSNKSWTGHYWALKSSKTSNTREMTQWNIIASRQARVLWEWQKEGRLFLIRTHERKTTNSNTVLSEQIVSHQGQGLSCRMWEAPRQKPASCSPRHHCVTVRHCQTEKRATETPD